MSCELTSGYTTGCDESAGIEAWYAFSLKNRETLTVVDGAVTALTLASGKYAYPFNVEQETSSFTDTAVGEKANKGYGREQSATVMLHGNTAEMIVNIEAMAKDRTCWIAKLNDGTYELLFAEFGGKVIDERASGTAFEDMNGNTLTITGKEKTKAPKISSVIVLALLEPAS